MHVLPLGVNHGLFNQAPIDGHMGFAITNNATVNTLASKYVYILPINLCKRFLEVGLLCKRVNAFGIFLVITKLLSLDYTILHSHQQCVKVSSSVQPHRRLCC